LRPARAGARAASLLATMAADEHTSQLPPTFAGATVRTPDQAMKDRTVINTDQFLDRSDRSRGSIFWPYGMLYCDEKFVIVYN
jgi:hypothetical protein